MQKNNRLPLLAAALAGLAGTAVAQEVTTIQITDKVVVEKPLRLGMSFDCESNKYTKLPVAKEVAELNFEGGRERWIHKVAQDGSGEEITIGAGRPDMERYKGERYWIISGKSKWTEGRVQEVGKAGGKGVVLKLDKSVTVKKDDGVMLDYDHPEKGHDPTEKSGKMSSEANYLVSGDVPPGGGSVSYCLAGTKEPKAYLQTLSFFHDKQKADANGKWHIAFWAKLKEGGANLQIVPANEKGETDWGEKKCVTVTPEWKKYEISLAVDKMPDKANKQPHLLWRFQAENGDILLDNISVMHGEHKNPTRLRDEVLETLKKFKPGLLRPSQDGAGSTLANVLTPGPTKPFNPPKNRAGSLVDNLVIAEAVGDCEAYLCTPACISREEMGQLIEYLNAPANVGLGKLRAEHGHPKPWLETIPGIVIEIGNEVANFGGYGGPDYWQDLVEAGKKSPHYSPKIQFSLGAQGRPAENMDALAVAGYSCWGFNKEHEQYLDTDEKLFNWAKAWNEKSYSDPDFNLKKEVEKAGKLGKPLVMYEGNYHTNFGTAGPDVRNKLVASVGGAVHYTQRMLEQMRRLNMRKQMFFNLQQLSMIGTGNFGSKESGEVKIWGSVLGMSPGKERYRPSFLGLVLANRAIMGNMVETKHSGANPTCSSTGVFAGKFVQVMDTNKLGQMPIETVNDLPVVHSYAFADGKKRGLLLFNTDVTAPHTVKLAMPWTVAGGKALSCLLTSDKPTDNNEWESGEAKVKLVEKEMTDFSKDKTIVLPACSAMAIAFDVQ